MKLVTIQGLWFHIQIVAARWTFIEENNWLWDKIALKIMQFSLGRCARWKLLRISNNNKNNNKQN